MIERIFNTNLQFNTERKTFNYSYNNLCNYLGSN